MRVTGRHWGIKSLPTVLQLGLTFFQFLTPFTLHFDFWKRSKTVSEAVFLIDIERGDMKRLQNPGSQRDYDWGLGRTSLQPQGKAPPPFGVFQVLMLDVISPLPIGVLIEMEGHGINTPFFTHLLMTRKEILLWNLSRFRRWMKVFSPNDADT